MTRRERAIARLERRREWAAGRMAKAQACHAIGDRYRGDIAFCTQPGHIPERARVIRATEKAFEHAQVAEHHQAKAAGTERMLETTIFSDDENAVEAIRDKVAGLRAQVEKMKAANKIIRKFKDDKHNGRLALEQAGFTARQAARLFEPDFAGRLGFPSFELTNTGANIRRLEGRIIEIERRKARTEKAEASGGVTIEGGDWVRVTFAEKPEYAIIAALKSAGFRWGGGSWTGEREKIPAEVFELIHASDPTFDPILTEIAQVEPATGCACLRGFDCDVVHDSAFCPCKQCTEATAKTKRMTA